MDDPRRRLETHGVRLLARRDVGELCARENARRIRRKGDGGEKRKNCRDGIGDFHNCRRLYHCPLFEVNRATQSNGVELTQYLQGAARELRNMV